MRNSSPIGEAGSTAEDAAGAEDCSAALETAEDCSATLEAAEDCSATLEATELSSSLDASAEEETIASLELCSEELCALLLSDEVTAVAEEDFASEEEAGIEVPWLEVASEVCTAEEDCTEVAAEDDSPREETGPIMVPQLASTTAVRGKRNKVVRFTKNIIGHGHKNGDSNIGKAGLFPALQ